MTTDNDNVFHECGPGWSGLVAPIVAHANEIGVTITQVKEKFGCLRVYFDPGQSDTDKLEDMIDAAELASATICEMCGAAGLRLSKGGWQKVLCKQHAIELGYNKGKSV